MLKAESGSIVLFFIKHIRPYKWHYFLMILAPLASSYYPFAYNYSIKLFLDIMANNEIIAYQDIILPIIIFISAQMIVDVAWRISDIAKRKSIPQVRKSILLDAYNSAQNHSYTFYQNNFTGATSSKIKSIVDGYDMLWTEIHDRILCKALKSIICLSALIFINTMLGIFVLLWVCLFIYCVYNPAKELHSRSFIESESKHKLIGGISDRVLNILSILSCATKQEEVRSLDSEISNEYIPKQIETYKSFFKIQMIASVLYVALFSFLLFYMINLRMHGLVTIGDFAFVFGLSLVIASDVYLSMQSMQEINRLIAELRSAFSVIATAKQPNIGEDINNITITNPTINIVNLSFGYHQNVNLFNKVNINIFAGEKIGIVGPSGAGKTSLINLILKHYSPDKGSILIDGQNIKNINTDSLRKQIAVIPQDIILFHRTLLENIKYGCPETSDEEVYRVCKEVRLDEFIQNLPQKYNTYVGERGVKLSGGQRQRISIARAIIKNAPILVLDEATSSLDSKTEEVIQEALSILLNKKNKTVLVVAHRFSTLKHMDRILVMNNGKIVEQGSHYELLTNRNGLYTSLWNLQKDSAMINS